MHSLLLLRAFPRGLRRHSCRPGSHRDSLLDCQSTPTLVQDGTALPSRPRSLSRAISYASCSYRVSSSTRSCRAPAAGRVLASRAHLPPSAQRRLHSLVRSPLQVSQAPRQSSSGSASAQELVLDLGRGLRLGQVWEGFRRHGRDRRCSGGARRQLSSLSGPGYPSESAGTARGRRLQLDLVRAM